MDDSGTLRVKAFDRQCDRVFARACIGEVYTSFLIRKVSVYIDVSFWLNDVDDSTIEILCDYRK